MKTLSDIQKEFDEKFSDKDFCCCGREYCYPEDNANYEPIIKIKSFINQSLEELLEQVVPEERRDDVNKGGGQYGHPETDFDTGFNACRQEVEERIKKILNN